MSAMLVSANARTSFFRSGLLLTLALTLAACSPPQRTGPSRPSGPYGLPPEMRQPEAPEPSESTDDMLWQSRPALPAQGGRIALLLPMSGPYQSSAQAVRDGFLAEFYGEGALGEVKLYDVGDSPEWLNLAYRNALNDGVDMIVGPLKKESVVQLALMAPQVPVLSLNYMDAGQSAPYDFYQFGLAPEDEARAAADDAGSKGLRNAVALVPESDWGTRVLDALDARMRMWGGSVIASARYRQGVSDQGDAISRLMGVSDSQERHRALTRALGQRTEFDGGSRSDIDFIFLAGRAQDARVLMPQFKFYRAGGLPHYATSLVYEGRGSDTDLASLRFCDMPFMVDSAGGWASERQAAARMPSAQAYPRLYALGLDAYRVASALARREFGPGMTLAGASGWMEWGNGTLTRRLECMTMTSQGLVPTTQF